MSANRPCIVWMEILTGSDYWQKKAIIDPKSGENCNNNERYWFNWKEDSENVHCINKKVNYIKDLLNPKGGFKWQ